MFEVDGTSYELSYGVKRIEMCEATIKKGVIQAFQSMPTISDLAAVIAYGMRRDGETAWVNYKQAFPVAEAHIEEVGYMTAYREVTDALDRDCGFLFR